MFQEKVDLRPQEITLLKLGRCVQVLRLESLDGFDHLQALRLIGASRKARKNNDEESYNQADFDHGSS